MKHVTINYSKVVLVAIVFSLFGQIGHTQIAKSYDYQQKELSEVFHIKKGTDLKEALDILEKRFNVVFLYRTDAIEKATIHSQIILPENIEKALNILLSGTNLEFSYLNPKTYGIYKMEEALPETPVQDIQQEIRGRVVEAGTGTPLPGVNITVAEFPNIGTSTNLDGEYTLVVPEEATTLIFSFLGFETREVNINGRTIINIELAEVVLFGDEMVVTGYGLQRKSDFTGSVGSVEGERLATVPSHSFEDALQGKVAGVQVIPVDGRPGSTPQIRIRGVGTLNDASPLFVVDGLLLDDISFLDTKDIQSAEVLKDASATAIYGSRGANGVIVITTKQGRVGEPRINIRTSTGVQRISNKINVANAREFATLANESAANEGRGPVFENPDQVGPGTDWLELVSDGSAILQNYQVSVGGGSDRSTYFVSANYFQEDGVIKGANFQRVNLRVNNEYFATDNITLGHNIAFTFKDSENEAGGLITQALRADPTTQPRDEEGNFFDTTINGGSANPAASMAFNNNDNFGFRVAGNAFLRVNFLKNFDFRTSFGLDWGRDESKVFVPEFDVSALQQNTESRLSITDNKETNWVSETTLNYNENFGDHRIDLLGGLTFQEFKFENLGGSRINFPGTSSEFFFLNAGESEGQTNFNTSFAWGVISYIARANYVFKDRYLLTGTFRRDGSSRFASANRWANFPSVAVGWLITNEPFFQDVPYISFLKIRA
ncbi:MAG: SusC/RagA family TonB-linked outer membrane protein, partial [Balneolaceae bacterium]